LYLVNPRGSFARFGLALALSTLSATAVTEPARQKPANVILLIGDGMDQQQLTIARNYLAGSSGMLLMDTLETLAAVRVQTVSVGTPKQFVYVADSANSATTLATGIVTSIGRIAMDHSGTHKLSTIVELAQRAGYRTGIVTTASVTDATPAAFASHSVHRKCEGPSDLRAASHWYGTRVDCSTQAINRGGPGSIANQLSRSRLDILLGGGSRYFEQAAFGGEMRPLDTALESGFFIATDSESLDTAPLDRPLLGLFAAATMPVKLMGQKQRRAEPVPTPPSTPGLAGQAFECVANPGAALVPDLKSMTEKALELLGREPQSGFFLMVESASIDKQSHARQPCGHIGEVRQLDRALQSALKFAKQHPNTLILVTADHGHAAQIIPDQEHFSFGDNAYHSPGAVARVRTPEGSIMMLNYATSVAADETHTGTNVPLLASGPGADAIPAYLTQADIYHLMMHFLELL
jgi:alkaline phosphatase